MLSACTRKFLSHPIEDEKNSLIKHLLEIGKTADKIFTQTTFTNTSLAFYSGLLHDIGKINPYYQEMFHTTKNNREQVKEKALEKYVGEHARFSAWTVDKLLEKSDLDYSTIQKITVLVYGHHSTIRRNLGIVEGDKFTATKDAISKVLPEFALQVSDIPELSKLNWDSCYEEFQYPAIFNVELESKNSPYDYLEMSYAFSCLLQADRGSFHEWLVPNFDLHIDTEPLVKKSQETKTQLGQIRSDFQSQVMKNFDDDEPISVINAPTGIGKTKVFLDIISKYSTDKEKIHSIFYFSPLLALTEDFENKIAKVISDENAQEDILIYNHMFSDSLKKRQENNIEYSNSWVFENESFNKKFVITTTQRLLMTIYSNKTQDKMKLASFRNSVLIIDEVQTIPKPILSNLKEIFKKMNQYMRTKFILVSATIPHELNDIKKVKLSKDILDDYLKKIEKQISFAPLDVTKIPIERTLVMANTRKKAVTRYSEIIKVHPDKDPNSAPGDAKLFDSEIKQTYSDKDIIYISTGIKKQDRKKILKDLQDRFSKEKEKSKPYVLVSTQVVEAGVDISFSHVFREEAPLDNIIQVMGRLNREGENSDAELVIYPTTDGKSTPYSTLEFQVSQEKIKKIIQEKTNSVGLYDVMEEYYSEIYEKNLSNQNGTQELERCIKRMDFDGVWEFVKELAIPKDDRGTVFIPEPEKWESVRKGLLDGTKKNFKEFGELTASLPISVYKLQKLKGKNYFDEELMEKNILLPQKQYLEEVYDKNTGLDKWLIE